MPCYSDAFKATILFRHESTSCSSNRFDGSYAPPNPAPLAAAGVRGGLYNACLRQEKKHSIATLFLA